MREQQTKPECKIFRMTYSFKIEVLLLVISNDIYLYVLHLNDFTKLKMDV